VMTRQKHTTRNLVDWGMCLQLQSFPTCSNSLLYPEMLRSSGAYWLMFSHGLIKDPIMSRKRKIIILEDDPIFLFRIQHMLDGLPYEITTCGTVKECATQLENNNFDCAILDYNLPDGTSLDIVEMVKEKDMAALILSAATEQKVVRDSFKSGCFDFISKAEINNEVVLNAIDKTLCHSDLLKERRLHQEELQNFVRTVAHDLKTPLSSLNGYLFLTRMAIDDNEKEEMLDSLSKAENASQDMASLIDALLECTRLGKTFTTEPVELSVVMDTVKSRASKMIEENKATIVCDPDPLPQVIGDRNLLTQILQNLITNSIKYRSEEDPIISISVTVDPEHHGKAEISIKDNGLGIDSAYHEKIFHPLERAVATTQEGYGIGLATCKRIAERHGGEIWVESELGKGSTFYFTIEVESI